MACSCAPLPPLLALLLLLLLLLLQTHPGVDCGRAQRVKRVVGGVPLLPRQWPFLVSLHYKKPHNFTINSRLKHLCGGTLIKRKWVLTAGHCFDGNQHPGLEDPKNWVVVLGEHNQFKRENGEQRLKIKQIFQHENYSDRPLLNDLSLVKLKKAAQLTPHVQPIRMDKKGKCSQGKGRLSVGGWGQLSYEPHGWGTYIPLWVNLTLVSKAACVAAYEKVPKDAPERVFYSPTDPGLLCAGHSKGGKDACLGDSGGPLVCKKGKRWLQTGIVSTGYECGKKGFPGLYARLDAYFPWINKTIKAN